MKTVSPWPIWAFCLNRLLVFFIDGAISSRSWPRPHRAHGHSRHWPRTPEDLDPVFPALARERVDVVIALRDPLFFTRRRTLTAAALASRLPTIYAFHEPVDDSGLISYGIDISQNFRAFQDLDHVVG